MAEAEKAPEVVQDSQADLENLLKSGLQELKAAENLPVETEEVVEQVVEEQVAEETENVVAASAAAEAEAKSEEEVATAAAEAAKEVAKEEPKETTGNLSKGLQKTQKRLSFANQKLDKVLSLLEKGEKTPEAEVEAQKAAKELTDLQAEIDKIEAGNTDDPLRAMQALAKSHKLQALRNRELEEQLARTKTEVQNERQANQDWDTFEKANPHLGGKGRETWKKFVSNAEKKGSKGEAIGQRAEEDWKVYLEAATKPGKVLPSKTGTPLKNKQVVKTSSGTVANPTKLASEDDFLTLMKKDLNP